MILLPVDECVLYPPSGEQDEHGWATGPGAQNGPAPSWSGNGNLQLSAGVSGTDAAESGGHGPFEPNSLQQGVVYLPDDAPAADGVILLCRGKAWSLSFTRLVPDPSGGPLGAVVANVSEVEAWLQARSL